MEDMAFDGKWQPLFKFLGERIEAAVGLRNLIQAELALQVFLNTYLGLCNYFLVYPEKELNKGFADLVLEPYTVQYPTLKYAFIIEIKYIKPTKGKNPTKAFEKQAREAKSQLSRYQTDERFRKSMGKAEIIPIVLIFNGHRLVHME